MKVFYDHTAFIPPFGGVAKYHVEVMKRLPPHMYVLSAIGSGNQYLRESGLGHCTLPRHLRGSKYWMTPITAAMITKMVTMQKMNTASNEPVAS